MFKSLKSAIAKIRNTSQRIKIIGSIFILNFIICAVLVYFSHLMLTSKTYQTIKDSALKISYLTSLIIDSENFEKLIDAMKNDLSLEEIKNIEQSNDYMVIYNQINKVRGNYKDLIKYIYTLTDGSNDGRLRFVVDGDALNYIEETDLNNLEYSHFSKEYLVEEFPTMLKAYNEQKNLVEENFTYDKEFNIYSISSYAPIFNETGKFLGIIGVDIEDKYLSGLLAKNLVKLITISLILIFVSFLFSILLGRIFTVNINRLINSIENFKKDFSVRNKSSSKDELGKLSSSFNEMAEAIQNYSSNLEESVKKRTELLDEIIYAVGAIVIVLETGGKIMKFNRKCEEITGFKEKEVVGKSIWDFLKPNKEESDMNDVFEILLNTILTSSFESPLITGDGKEIYVLWNNTAIKDKNDKIIWTIGTGVDITERVKAEEEIKTLNEDLEKRVAERTRQLGEVVSELQETLSALKSAQNQLIQSEKMASLGSLVAGVSHEINTPVGIGITAATYLDCQTKEFLNLYKNNQMKKSDLDKLMSIIGESVPIILSNLTRAAELTQSFKKVAVDQSNEEKRAFKIMEYTNEILISLKPKIKKTKIKIIVERQEDFEVDNYPGAFSQILTNLIMNSLIHAFEPEKEGIIKIAIWKENELANIIFSDNGSGISKENIKKIFEPFFTTKRGYGGTGLGLHIVFNIINRQMLGTIECDSEIGVGTKFIIKFPIMI